MKHLLFSFIILALFSCSENKEPQSSKADTAEKAEMTMSEEFSTEISELSQHPKIQSAFQHIEENDPKTIEDLIMLTGIPAPPFKEEVRGAKYAEMLVAEGLDSVWTDEIGNVIGLRKGRKGDKVLALAAHLDTVFPEGTPTTVTQRGDTLFAPGVADDTRGLVTLLAVLRAMNAANIQTEDDILFIGDVGEEGLGDLRGMKHLFRDGGPKIDYFISVDGTDAKTMTNQGLGSHRYRITFKGPGGHSWGAFGLANPHHALGAAIKYFVDEADKYTKDGAKTSYNVGRIGGGTSVNSIPFESWMEIDMRSESPERLIEIDSILQKAIRKGVAEQNDLKRNGRPIVADIKMIGQRPSGSTITEDPLVQRAWASTEQLNLEPKLRIGSTDSNIPISKGIPSVTLGGGGIGKGAHSLGEYFVNTDGHVGIQRVLLIVAAQTQIADEVNLN
ncbi:MAG: M20/M25/M40 family metallo-hydrolase [Cyclobacteriaceae bacterium]